MRISVTVHDNEGKGSLDFWYKTFKNLNERNRADKYIEIGDFNTALGEKGKYLVFEKQISGVDHLYIVGVVRTDKKVYLLEAGGEKAKVEADKQAIIKSFSTLK